MGIEANYYIEVKIIEVLKNFKAFPLLMETFSEAI